MPYILESEMKMEHSEYFNGLNEKLYKSLPRRAKNILELGCANGRLGEFYKKSNPDSRWVGVDVDDAAIAAAEGRLDKI